LRLIVVTQFGVVFSPGPRQLTAFKERMLLRERRLTCQGGFVETISMARNRRHAFSDFAQLLCPNKQTPDIALQTPPTDLTIAQAPPASPSSSAPLSASDQAPDQAMAFQVADPSPFVPRGFQKLEVQGRKQWQGPVPEEPCLFTKTGQLSPSNHYPRMRYTSQMSEYYS
jgi:hypothetical protein